MLSTEDSKIMLSTQDNLYHLQKKVIMLSTEDSKIMLSTKDNLYHLHAEESKIIRKIVRSCYLFWR